MFVQNQKSSILSTQSPKKEEPVSKEPQQTKPASTEPQHKIEIEEKEKTKK